MKYYVYELWDIIKNELFYVGKGCGKRSYSHTSKSNLAKSDSNQFKKNVIRKMLLENNKPVTKYVFRTDDELSAYIEETRLIMLYGRRDIGTGFLTNLTDGGVGSLSPNDLTRAKLSKARLGKKDSTETRLKKAASSKNRIITNETRQKMSIVKLGKIPACVELRRSYEGEGNPQFGKIWSDEKRSKMSNSIKGRKRSYRPDGTWFFTYPEKV
jgi:hypothetical protein